MFWRNKEYNITALKTTGRMMAIVLLVVLVLSMTACGEKNSLTIATGYEGGSYYNYGNMLAEQMSEQYGGEIKVRETPGTASNIKLVNKNIANVALAQADIVNETLHENKEDNHEFHVLGSVYSESMLLIVRNDSGIASVNQLKGSRIAVGEKGSATAIWAEEIRKYALINKNGIDFDNMSMNDALKAVETGTADGCFLIMDCDNPEIKEFVENQDVSVIGFSQDIIKFAIDEFGYITECTIPAGTYENQNSGIKTLGVPALLIASDKMDEKTENLIIQTINNSKTLGSLTEVNASAREKEEGTPLLELDMYMTLALAVLCLMLGIFLRRKIYFLVRFCIPAPVVGGLIFAVFTCILYSFNVIEISFDETFKDICMMIFFTSVGFQGNFKTLKAGGKTLIILIALVAVLATMQNFVALGLAKAIGQTPLLGMTTGSVPMLGGHGIGGAFGPIIEGLGLEGASTICIAAATFGLVAGSLMGGPLADHLIEKKNLLSTADFTEAKEESRKSLKAVVVSYSNAAYHLAVAMGIGALIMLGLNALKLTFPMYMGGMIVAVIMRNLGEKTGKFVSPMREIEDIGEIALSLFLGIAMISLKLWQLADLALPLIILLVGQVLLMFAYARFVAFNFLGRDYDAAVITAGLCGFGMGATPNAMANMQAVAGKYVNSAKAFLIVPITGAMFNDIFNSGLITVILNIVK